MKPISFIRDVAPILVENCIACHNPRKSESKYVMTTFAQLAKGGQQGEGITLEPGKPDESYLVELIRPGGQPRMPYKQDPLPAEKIATIERWVAEGAKYDGGAPAEDWTIVLRKTQSVSVPEAYPAAVPITALGVHAGRVGHRGFGLSRDQLLEDRGRRAGPAAWAGWPSGPTTSPTARTASGWPPPAAIRGSTAWPGSGRPRRAPGRSRSRDLVETQDVVFSVAFSPDSKRIATAGADRAIRIFEVETGKLVFQVEDHADWIFAVAFSPDGKRLASASRDKTCKVFDVEKKESLVTFPGHAQPVYTVAFAPDGKSVASGGEDNQIRRLEPRRRRPAGPPDRRLRRHRLPAPLHARRPDARRLQRRQAGPRLQGRMAHRSANCRATRTGSTPGHLHDGKTIASGSWDGEVRLWNLADGKPVRNFIAAPGYKPAPTTKAAAR